MSSNTKNHLFNIIGKGKYEVFGVEIGRGGFGLVYLARAKETSKLCAIKVQILNDANIRRVFEQEVFYLASLRSTGIVEFIESYCINFCGQEMGVIVMEKMDTDLMEYKLSGVGMSVEGVKAIFRSMCESVAYCHSKNIAHFDIKLENYLLQLENNVVRSIKLCDFGSAKDLRIKVNNSNAPHGTSEYLPPEMLNCTNFQVMEEKVDIWSLGVSLCILITGRYPFSSDFNELLNVADNLLLLFRESYMSPQLLDLLLSIFKINPADRISAFQILTHPWLTTAC